MKARTTKLTLADHAALVREITTIQSAWWRAWNLLHPTDGRSPLVRKSHPANRQLAKLNADLGKLKDTLDTALFSDFPRLPPDTGFPYYARGLDGDDASRFISEHGRTPLFDRGGHQ